MIAMSLPAPAVSWNPLAPGYADDPWPQYAELVESGFGRHEFGAVTVWRHKHVSAVLRAGLSVENAETSPHASMLERDPPHHTRLRSLSNKAFTPRAIADLEPLVSSIADEALDAFSAAGGGDLVPDVAFAVPFRVITEMLGMPDVDTVGLRRLTSLLVAGLEPIFSEEQMAAVTAANVEFMAIIGEAIAWKRGRLADDMLSALIQAESEGDRLSPEELAEQVALIYVAGHETTVNLISGGTLALLENPEQAARLRRDDQLDCVEELLRYDSPVHITGRRTTEPFEIDGHVLPADTQIIVGLAAANRDPRVFGDDASSVRLGRTEAPQHLSFSAGVHHCLGSALARLEGRTVIPRLIRRFPDLHITAPVVWNGRVNLRGPASLPVTVAS